VGGDGEYDLSDVFQPREPYMRKHHRDDRKANGGRSWGLNGTPPMSPASMSPERHGCGTNGGSSAGAGAGSLEHAHFDRPTGRWSEREDRPGVDRARERSYSGHGGGGGGGRGRGLDVAPGGPPGGPRRRRTGFDQIPDAVATAAAAATLVANLATATEGMDFQGRIVAQQQASQQLSALQTTGVNVQATRHARRVYVGGLAAEVEEASLSHFMEQVMEATGATRNCGVGGGCVVSVYINREKLFAFVEFKTVEEARALDPKPWTLNPRH